MREYTTQILLPIDSHTEKQVPTAAGLRMPGRIRRLIVQHLRARKTDVTMPMAPSAGETHV